MDAAGVAKDRVSPRGAQEVQQWMDALASGARSPADLLQQILPRTERNAELKWEALAQLDQHFRRKRISREVFTLVKAALSGHPVASDSSVPAIPRLEPHIVMQQVAPPQPQGAFHAGDLIRGRYRVMETLRRDAAGTLVEAVDEHRVDIPDIRQRVALLLVDDAWSTDSSFLQRMFRLQALGHPCIQRVYDIDEEQGRLFVAMDWLSGLRLPQLVEMNGGERLPISVAQAILRSVASALSYAHARGVFHGDVVPRNVRVTEAGEVCLAGFVSAGAGHSASAAGDRQAFARLAYDLLSGVRQAAGLRQPPGLSPDQWQLVRDTLQARDLRNPAALLGAFAGDADFSSEKFVALRSRTVEKPPNTGRRSLVAGIAVMVLAVAALLLFSPDDSPPQREPPASPVASTAAPDATPAATLATTAATPEPQITAPEVQQRGASVEMPAAPAVPASLPAAPSVLELTAGTLNVDGSEPFAVIRVSRGARASSAVTFRWGTEPGSARTNEDFLGIQPRWDMIPAGSSGTELRVPLLSDPTRDQPRAFLVRLEEVGPGGRLGEQIVTRVIIQPSTAPVEGLRPSGEASDLR